MAAVDGAPVPTEDTKAAVKASFDNIEKGFGDSDVLLALPGGNGRRASGRHFPTRFIQFPRAILIQFPMAPIQFLDRNDPPG